MSKLTIAELKIMRESEDHVEFKKGEHGNVSYNGADKQQPKDRRRCILGYVTALCNEKGGHLVIGMSDKHPHEVVGTLQCVNAIGQLESDIYRDTGIRPKVYELFDDADGQGKRVLVIEVPSRPVGKVFKFEDVPLMRVGEELKPMDDKMVEWLFRNPLSDGGQFTGISDLFTKYGVVPKEVMAETYSSDNTSEIASLMKRKLREYGLQLRELSEQGKNEAQLEQQKVEMLKTIYKMLVYAYGEPVKTFKWAPKKDGKIVGEEKEYTPQSFYKEVCGGEDLNADYVMLMNDPSREYNKVYEIDYDRHTYDGHNWLYLNLPIEEIKKMAIASLKDSTMMYFSCDVGKFLDSKRGTLDLKNYDYESLFGTTFGMNKKQRIQSFDSGSTHAMTLMAVDLDADGKPTKWMVENSWGASAGYKGHLIMTDEWFDEYMFRVVVNKKYCPAEILKLLNQKPVRLPAWDPMFQNEQ